MSASYGPSDSFYFELDRRNKPSVTATDLPKAPKALSGNCGPQYIPRRCVITADEAELSLDVLKNLFLRGALQNQRRAA